MKRLLNRSGKNDSSLHRTEPEGFGACSAGGAGGKTIWVENLDDSGTGSFRDAVTAKGPRIVKFRVGGIIKLSRPVYVEQGRLTIDGASAMKQGGITLCGQGLVLKGLECRDVIIRHIRVRRSHKNGDCISIAGGAHRILVDHCSVSWADDENFGINQGHNVTVQWCIIAEGLVEGTHDKGSHSCGMLVAHGANHVTVHHNFFAGNNARNALLYGVGGTGTGGAIPETYPGEDMAVFMPNAVFDFRNNLIYNYRYGAQLGCGMYANVVRNSYRNAPGIPEGSPIYIDKKIYYPGSELPQLWYQGNILLEPQNEGATEREIVCDPDFRSDHPILTPPVRTHSARQAVTLILKHAGASPRDDVDTRVVEEFHSGMGRIGNGYLDWNVGC